MTGKSPELIARFQALQTMILHTGFENLKFLETLVSTEIHRLIEELAKSMIECADRIELQNYKQFNPSLEYKLQSDVFRNARAEHRNDRTKQPSASGQEKKMSYESRILIAIAAVCCQFPLIANSLLESEISIDVNTGRAERTDRRISSSFVIILIEVLDAVGYLVGD